MLSYHTYIVEHLETQHLLEQCSDEQLDLVIEGLRDSIVNHATQGEYRGARVGKWIGGLTGVALGALQGAAAHGVHVAAKKIKKERTRAAWYKGRRIARKQWEIDNPRKFKAWQKANEKRPSNDPLPHPAPYEDVPDFDADDEDFDPYERRMLLPYR